MTANSIGSRMLANLAFMTNMVDSCPDGIIGVDRQGMVVIFNAAAERLTGFKADEVLGQVSITQVYNPPAVARQVKKALYAQEHGGVGRVDELEVEVVNTRGQVVPIRLSAALLVEDGQELGSVGFFHDMTVRKQMETELRRRSVTDSLTSLFNRRHFHSTLGLEVDRAVRYQRPLTLAFFDLDHFKPFNDTYGHQEGDNILRMVSDSMRRGLRNLDQAFRLGGDEFGFILVETTAEQGLLAMERFRQSFNQQWPSKMSYLGEDLEPVTLSIGLAQLAKNEKADQLVRRADLAMYEAKKDGGDRTVRARQEIKE